MVALQERNVFFKLWQILRTYILTLKRFDLNLQGSLLIVVLLETNCYLLLRREVGMGKMPALLEDWVLVGVGGVEFIFGTALAWFGQARRHFMLSAWLAVTAVTGASVLAFPFEESYSPFVYLCGGERVAEYSGVIDTAITPRRIMLILTIVMCSLTKISIWAHGLTYLDDHEPHNGPYFYGILISIRLSLGLSGQNILHATALRDDWWVSQITLAMMTLTFAVFFTLFPRKMPQWKPLQENDEGKGFVASLCRVLNNKALVIQSLGLSFLTTALFAFISYEKVFVQGRFHVEAMRQDPRTSRAVTNIYQSMVVIFFILIFRVRFSDRRRDAVKANTASKVGGVTAVFVAIFFCVLAILPCDLETINGIKDGTFTQPTCSQDCGCNSALYGFSPVCALDTGVTHFSPCNAGCRDYEDLNGYLLFYNCTCGTWRAARGACSITTTSCRVSYSLYQIFFTLCLAITDTHRQTFVDYALLMVGIRRCHFGAKLKPFVKLAVPYGSNYLWFCTGLLNAISASLLMQGMVALRAVSRRDKPLAMGATFAIVALLSDVPGHLLYKLISSLTCAYQRDDGGACVFHNSSIWVLAAVSAFLSLASAVTSIIASRVSM